MYIAIFYDKNQHVNCYFRPKITVVSSRIKDGSLRSAIEVLVEMHMLCGTVKRYQRNVAVTNFEKIKTDKIDQHRERLSSIFSRCCGFIEGHTNPEEIVDKPDLDSLKIDFDEVLIISKDFI